MGFADSYAYLASLVSRNSDLQLDLQRYATERLYLANQTNQFFSQQAKLEPKSPAASLLEARIRQLQQADKQLELQIQRINTQLQAISKEMEAAQKIISQSVKSSFGLSGIAGG